MGIYPTIEYEFRPEGGLSGGRRRKARLLKKTTEPGLETIEVYVLQKVIRNRTDCYCCSCEEVYPGQLRNDPVCRNHGFAGRRPCEYHGLPGDPWDDEMVDSDERGGAMPESVQEVFARRERQREAEEHRGR